MGNKSSLNVLVISAGSVGIVHLASYLAVLKQQDWSVKCILTPAAAGLIMPSTVAAYVDTFVDGQSWGASVARVPHMDLGQWADCCVVLPATADIIGHVACGLAQNLATTTILAFTKPLLFFPNMEESMASKPAVVRNIGQLESDGCYVHTEWRKSYSVGLNRDVFSPGMPPPDVVVEQIRDVLSSLKGGDTDARGRAGVR